MGIEQFVTAESIGRLGDVLLLIGPDGRLIDANSTALTVYGCTRDQLLHLGVLDLAPANTHAAILQEIHAAGAEGLQFEDVHVRRDATTFPCEIHAIEVFDGDRPLVLATLRDITHRKEAEASLRRSQARFENIAATIPGVLYEYEVYRNGGGSYLYVGPGCRELLGIDEQAMLATVDPLWKLVHPDDIDRVLAENEAADGVGITFSTDFRIITPARDLKWIHMASRQLPSQPGVPDVWCGLMLDITRRKLAEAKLHQRDQDMGRLNAELARLAASDSLTGLASRRHFYVMLERTIAVLKRHGGSLSVVSFDLDGLKRANDSMGHAAGDRVITSFAAVLAEHCRSEDVAGRLGGDEFSVILPGVDADAARDFGERVLDAVRACAPLSSAAVTASGGVAQWRLHDRSDDVLRRADEALYRAKRSGGDAVHG